MTHIRIPFAPGINKEDTDLANEGRWRDGNLVRFRDGKPESVLGWTNLGIALTGVARAAESWQQLDGNRNIGFGTTKALYVVQGTERHDVTPIRRKVPVDDYLQPQKRFAHLFRGKGQPETLSAIQAIADRNIRRFGLLQEDAS